MKGGGCHAYFSKQYFEKAKKSVAELQIRRPDLAAQVNVAIDKVELARLRIPNAVGAIVQKHAARLWPYKLVSWILESLIINKKEKEKEKEMSRYRISHSCTPCYKRIYFSSPPSIKQHHLPCQGPNVRSRPPSSFSHLTSPRHILFLRSQGCQPRPGQLFCPAAYYYPHRYRWRRRIL